MEEHVVRTDKLPNDLPAMERLLLNRSVILCTVSTLSNPTIFRKNVFKLVPVERLIVDEASQIYVGAYAVSPFMISLRKHPVLS